MGERDVYGREREKKGTTSIFFSVELSAAVFPWRSLMSSEASWSARAERAGGPLPRSARQTQRRSMSRSIGVWNMARSGARRNPAAGPVNGAGRAGNTREHTRARSPGQPPRPPLRRVQRGCRRGAPAPTRPAYFFEACGQGWQVFRGAPPGETADGFFTEVSHGVRWGQCPFSGAGDGKMARRRPRPAAHPVCAPPVRHGGQRHGGAVTKSVGDAPPCDDDQRATSLHGTLAMPGQGSGVDVMWRGG